MKEQKVNLKLVLTEGYEKRFTEAVCKVWTNRNKQLVPPENKRKAELEVIWGSRAMQEQ